MNVKGAAVERFQILEEALHLHDLRFQRPD